ncbi:MAG: hypothetical protein ACRC30_05045 [Clostridium sp.]
MVYPNTDIEKVNLWLNDIEEIKNQINEREKAMIEATNHELSRIANFIDRGILAFEIFENAYAMCRFNYDKNSFDDINAWDNLNLLRDELIEYRIQALEEESLTRLTILYEFAKNEAIKNEDIEIVEELEKMNAESLVANKGFDFREVLRIGKAPIYNFIQDAIRSSAEGFGAAIINHS